MNDLSYRFVAAGLQDFIWGGELTGEENLPEKGPAIFVANHLRALGPIAVVSSVPFRLYPWVASNMLDEHLAAEYLRWDFVERQLHLPMPYSLWLAKAISRLSVPLLNSLGGIPVFPNPDQSQATFEPSVNLLVQGKIVLVFPEDPSQPIDPLCEMSPFKKGFARLGELYFQRSGGFIQFYPLAVHGRRRCVQVGRPVTYNPFALAVNERLRIKRLLETSIHEMLLGMGRDTYLGVPLPH